MTLKEGKGEDLQLLIEAVDNSEISTIKSIVRGIFKIINDPRSSAKELKELIEVDPPLTSKLLKIANSAYYSLQRRISDIEQAIVLIGFDELKELALSQKVCEVFAKGEAVHAYSRPALWEHSLAVASMAKMIFRKEFGLKGDDVYAAGLVHDIGIIIEDQFLHRQFGDLLLQVHTEGKALIEAELDVFGFDHAEIGRALFRHWSFPPDFVDSIARHHEEMSSPSASEPLVLTLLIANHACLVHDIGYADSHPLTGDTYRRCLTALQIEPSSVNMIVEEVKSEIGEIRKRGLFSIG